MVYKLRKATRFMFIKVFIGITIFSLIVGTIASAVVGIAITFDNISYSPSLVNIDGGNIGLEECEEYRSESCDWILFEEIKNRDFTQINLKLNNEIANLERDYNKGSNIVITRQDIGEGDIGNVFLGRLILISPEESGDILCEDFSFINPDSIEKCNFSPFHVKSEINPQTNVTQSILVAEILVANHTTQEVLCNDFTNKFRCRLILNQETQQYEGFTTDLNFPCGDAGGVVTQINERSVCSLKAYRQLVSPQFVIPELNTSISSYRFDGKKVYCTYGNGTDICLNYREPFGTFGGITGVEEGIEETQLFFVMDQSEIVPGVVIFENLITPEEDLIDKSSANIQLSCFINRNIKFGLNCEFGGEVFGEHGDNILQARRATEFPKLLVRLDQENLRYKFGLVHFGQAKDVFQVLPFILNGPVILSALVSALPAIMNLILINVAIALIVSILGLWRRIGGRLTARFALAFKGRFGKMLELTQFFEFSGDWYLEAIAVHDYNFASYRSAFKELVTERWRDTIFFPVALAATISVLIVTITNNPDLFWTILIIAPILPILLTFWTPFIWIMQDSGLKRVNWGETGDVNAIERVSNIVRDGFNKIVGIGAILGLGTAGSTAIRSNITGNTFEDQFLTSSIESLLAFNLNFIVSTGLWTVGLFFLICAASLPGVILASLVYLNRGQISNVKKLREQMKKADIMFGTSTQMMQERDVSVYHDSSKKDDYSSEDNERREIKSFIDVPDVYDKDEEVSRVDEDREKKLDQAEKDGSLEIVDDFSPQEDETDKSSDESSDDEYSNNDY